MSKNFLVWGATAVVTLIVLWFIWTPMWNLIFGLWHGLVAVFFFVATPIWNIFLGALALATSAIMSAFSIAISAVISIGLLALVLLFGKWALGQVFNRFDDINLQIKNLGKSLSDDALRSGKDALFIALLSLLLAPVAYAATEDFLDKFSTIRLLAVCAFGFCIAKLFIMYPSRVAKVGGVTLTIAILTGCVAFLNFRYDLVSDAHSGFSNLRNFLFPNDPHVAEKQLIKLTIALVIAVLSGLAILYPFKPSEWGKMLRVSATNADSPKA